MKYAYICEKCGKQFSDYEKASKCEMSHRDVEPLYNYQLDQETRDKLRDCGIEIQEFKNGSTLPHLVWLKAPVYDGNGYPVYDEDGYQLYEAVCYERCNVDVAVMQVGNMLTNGLAAGNRERKADLDRILAEREAEKARKEAAETDPSTDPA